MSNRIDHICHLDSKGGDLLREALLTLPPADAAEALEKLDHPARLRSLNLLPLPQRAAVMAYLPVEQQVAALVDPELMEPEALFSLLPGDDRTDLYKSLPDEVRNRLLAGLESEEKDDLLELAGYPENTAGAVANSDFVALREDMSAAEALATIRREHADKESIYVLYVLDSGEKLLGTLSLRELVFAPADKKLSAIMRANPVTIAATSPKGEAADSISRYDLLALPVLDERQRMIGIITVDDAMDVAEAEDAANLARFGGTALDTELDLRTSSLRRIFGVRFFWLALLTVFGVLTSNVVAKQEELLESAIILAAFLAPIIDMGGNTGSQTATLVIRAMALGQVRMRMKDLLFVLRREMPVALLLGITIAILECILAVLSKGIGTEVMLTVGVSMFTVTLLGSLIGLFLPFAAKKIGTDPATLSSPLITSVMDILGVLIYFSFAYYFLADILEAA